MFYKILFDSTLYFVVFKVLQYIKRYPDQYNIFDHETLNLSIIAFSVVIASLLTNKYLSKTNSTSKIISKHFRAFFLTFGIMAFYILNTHTAIPSRFLLIGTITIGFLLELVTLVIIKKIRIKQVLDKSFKINLFIFLSDIIVLSACCYMFNIFKTFETLTSFRKIIIAIVFSGNWFLTHFFAHRFEFHDTNTVYWKFIWKYIKGNILFVSLTLFTVSMIIEIHSPVDILIKISLYYSLVNLLPITLYYVAKNPERTDEVKYTIGKATEVTPVIEEVMDFRQDMKCSFSDSYISHYLSEQLSTIYLAKFPEVYDFIKSNVDLFSFNFKRCITIRSSDVYNVEVLPNDSIELYMNLHEINDIRRINNYFININSKLLNNGIFIGKVETLSFRRERFFKTFPLYIAVVFYLYDFFWKRVTPKLPLLKRFYFGLTKGKDRVFSLAEALGRLYYCGFEIYNFKKIDGFLYFIATKVKEPSSDASPSYGPLIKLKRLGKDGKTINIYKFRTMYPYSEYLHSFILNQNGFSKIGKPAEDFRITTWGKFLRKYWLDELPQLINLAKGDLKLVGVRPISKRFVEEYPKDVLAMRFKNKPGCIPPYVALLKQNIKDYIESEKIYLLEYQRNPYLTDLKYLFKAVYNILTNKIRSS